VAPRSVASAYACRSLLASGLSCFSTNACYVVCTEKPASHSDRVVCRLDGCAAPTNNVVANLSPLAAVDVSLADAFMIVAERDGVFDLTLKRWAGEGGRALEVGDRVALAVVEAVDDDEDEDEY
jgi:hypothetical protein